MTKAIGASCRSCLNLGPRFEPAGLAQTKPPSGRLHFSHITFFHVEQSRDSSMTMPKTTTLQDMLHNEKTKLLHVT